MLEQLFGSKTRAKVLRLILLNPEKSFYVREITRKVNTQLNSVRTELNKMTKLGLVKIAVEPEPEPSAAELLKKKKQVKKSKKKNIKKKYYQANTEFVLFDELRSLLFKSQFILEKNFIKKLQNVGSVRYLVLTGFFTGIENSVTDLLIVGKVSKEKLKKIISEFEKDLCHEINYTSLSYREYLYRKDITDRFLYGILENKHLVVLDNI